MAEFQVHLKPYRRSIQDHIVLQAFGTKLPSCLVLRTEQNGWLQRIILSRTIKISMTLGSHQHGAPSWNSWFKNNKISANKLKKKNTKTNKKIHQEENDFSQT